MSKYIDITEIPNMQKDKIAEISLWQTATHWELDSIVIKQDHRKKGIGTKTMQQLIGLATESGVRIYLTPQSLLGSNRPRLLQFYRRLGFRKNPNPEIKHQMMSTNI
jgi:GNAT superfamily N-acetyltransferase